MAKILLEDMAREAGAKDQVEVLIAGAALATGGARFMSDLKDTFDDWWIKSPEISKDATREQLAFAKAAFAAGFASSILLATGGTLV